MAVELFLRPLRPRRYWPADADTHAAPKPELRGIVTVCHALPLECRINGFYTNSLPAVVEVSPTAQTLFLLIAAVW